MKFSFIKNNQNTLTRLRSLGYTLYRNRRGRGGDSFVRRLHGDTFPRFHLYVTEEDTKLYCSIHLDQTAPVYKGGHAHRGDYDSRVVKDEVKRLEE